MKKFFVFCLVSLGLFIFVAPFIYEIQNRRGCCSYHGGVCGCSSGRALCCDGTLSPSCGCD